MASFSLLMLSYSAAFEMRDIVKIKQIIPLQMKQVLKQNRLMRLGKYLFLMDGFDEIIVELIRAKTENENLRQQVNSLNKQVYILKKTKLMII